MKKICLACFSVMCLCISLYANAVDKIQFEQYVELTKKSKSNPKGMTVVGDSTYRIMYIALPIAINYGDVTTQVKNKMKENMLAVMRQEKADCKVIKDLKIRLIYSFITSDQKIFTITLNYQDI